MSTPSTASSYRELVRRKTPPPNETERSAEDELDSLIGFLRQRQKEGDGEAGALKPDAVQALRRLAINELIPVFVELVEKYSKAGISMQMDASNFLEGGREIKFEFGIGEHRSQLLGTVTTEAVAFHETRYDPDVQGELISGPMLRLRGLNGRVFRDFICERLALLIRAAMRRR